jgi:hypothetical protein
MQQLVHVVANMRIRDNMLASRLARTQNKTRSA